MKRLRYHHESGENEPIEIDNVSGSRTAALYLQN